jgi:hypothetical protein
VRRVYPGDVGVRLVAMAGCKASGMAWSAVPTTAHDGVVFHAGRGFCNRRHDDRLGATLDEQVMPAMRCEVFLGPRM